MYCLLLRPTRWSSMSTFIEPFRFGGRAVDPSLHEKRNTFFAMLRFFVVRKISISLSWTVFLFLPAPGLRRSSFRWVKAETSLWRLCWRFAEIFAWKFRVATRFVGFRFSTEAKGSLTCVESWSSKRMITSWATKSPWWFFYGFEVKSPWLDDWMVGRK